MSDLTFLDCPACSSNDWSIWITPSKVSCRVCQAVFPRSQVTPRGTLRETRSRAGSDARKRTRRSRKHESESAQKLGAETVAGSGNRRNPSGKGDFVVKELLRSEHKETQKSGFRLDLKTISKIEKEALATGTLPALHIRFVRSDGPDKTYVLLREDDLADLVEEVRATKNH